MASITWWNAARLDKKNVSSLNGLLLVVWRLSLKLLCGVWFLLGLVVGWWWCQCLLIFVVVCLLLKGMEFAVGDRCASFDGDADRLMYFYKDGEQNLFWSFVWCTSSCPDDIIRTTVQAGPQRSEELCGSTLSSAPLESSTVWWRRLHLRTIVCAKGWGEHYSDLSWSAQRVWWNQAIDCAYLSVVFVCVCFCFSVEVFCADHETVWYM